MGENHAQLERDGCGKLSESEQELEENHEAMFGIKFQTAPKDSP